MGIILESALSLMEQPTQQWDGDVRSQLSVHRSTVKTFHPSQMDPEVVERLLMAERKTTVDLLVPEAPSKEKIRSVKSTDELNPTDDELLAVALGSPARQVLTRAELLSPRTGWRDGHLSSYHGFCPPDPGASPT